MKKVIVIFILILGASLAVFLSMKKTAGTATKSGTPNPDKIRLALDWTPNTNHTGIFVAKSNGYFEKEQIELELLPFSSNASPDVLVATGKADVGISSTEWVVADKALGAPVVSIAAIIASNSSALVTLSSSPVKNPRDFSGKTYGGFGAPFEEAVVGEIIRKDGGNKTIKNVVLDVEALNALENKRIDFAWVYQGWEVIKARKDGFALKIFPIVRYGIADYYSPVFITSPEFIQKNSATLKKFMKALSRGYEFAILNPREAAGILIRSTPEGSFPDHELVYESQNFLSPLYSVKSGRWGFQEKSKWHDFPKFLIENGIISDQNGKTIKEMNFDSLYTNEFLPL